MGCMKRVASVFVCGKPKKDKRKLKLVLVGLDGAGKSTLLQTIRGVEPSSTMPTFGFERELVKMANFDTEIYDLGGGKRIRGIWKAYMADVHGVIFVVDSAADDRMEECRDIFVETLKDPHLSGKPILVFANKQDLPKAKGAAEVAQAMGLATLQNNRYNIVACTALRQSDKEATDTNIKAGMKWLTDHIDSEWGTLDPRVQKEAEEQARKEEELRKERVKKGEQARKERLEREAKEAEEKAKEDAAKLQESGEIETISIGPGPASESVGAAPATGGEASPNPSTPVKDTSAVKASPTVDVTADKPPPSDSIPLPENRGPLSPLPATPNGGLKPLDMPNTLSSSGGPSPTEGVGSGARKLPPLEPLGAPKNPLFDPKHEVGLAGARV